jgi:hypothetical protein
MVKLGIREKLEEWRRKKSEEKELYEKAFREAREEALREKERIRKQEIIERARKKAWEPSIGEKIWSKTKTTGKAIWQIAGKGMKTTAIGLSEIAAKGLKYAAKAKAKPRKRREESFLGFDAILGKGKSEDIRAPDLSLNFKDPFRTKGKKKKFEIW